MKASEILIAAKAKIENPEHWMKGYYAQDQHGNQILGNEEGAVCFCSLGAIEAVTGAAHCGRGWFYSPERFLNEAAGVGGIVHHNDSKSHGAVMAIWDKAIELAQTEEGGV